MAIETPYCGCLRNPAPVGRWFIFLPIKVQCVSVLPIVNLPTAAGFRNGFPQLPSEVCQVEHSCARSSPALWSPHFLGRSLETCFFWDLKDHQRHKPYLYYLNKLMYKRRWVKAFAAACNVLLWNKTQQQMREVFLGLQKDPRSQLASYSHGRDDPVVPWVSSLAVKTCGTSGRNFQHVILVHLIHISRKNRGSSRGVSCFLFMRFDVLWYKAGWYRNDTKDVFHPKLKLATVFWLRGWIFVWKLTFSDQDSSHRHEPFLLCVGVGREKTGGVQKPCQKTGWMVIPPIWGSSRFRSSKATY
jgi:hypothetical protein